MKHTVKQAEYLVHLLKTYVDPDAMLIGSLAKGAKRSTHHDIDVLLPSFRKSSGVISLLMRFLDTPIYEATDWGGVYFRNTFWGDVDIFFRMPK